MWSHRDTVGQMLDIISCMYSCFSFIIPQPHKYRAIRGQRCLPHVNPAMVKALKACSLSNSKSSSIIPVHRERLLVCVGLQRFSLSVQKSPTVQNLWLQGHENSRTIKIILIPMQKHPLWRSSILILRVISYKTKSPRVPHGSGCSMFVYRWPLLTSQGHRVSCSAFHVLQI